MEWKVFEDALRKTSNWNYLVKSRLCLSRSEAQKDAQKASIELGSFVVRMTFQQSGLATVKEQISGQTSRAFLARLAKKTCQH
jgi:hypothetical protein